jgi:protein-L-isoaspartate(D-aspartate) O-methyltransferase
MELRKAGVTDTRVLAAIERTPREAFAPPAFRDRAYENIALPIGAGQTLSQPVVVARMTQALQPTERVKVLEVGTGSGYQTAILARLFRRVYTVEQHRNLLREAERRFHALRISNITSKIGDGHAGWPEQAPFPCIIVTAAAAEIPETLVAQLAVGGVMVIPLGPRHGEQRLTRVVRSESGVAAEDLGPVRFVPLVAGGAA